MTETIIAETQGPVGILRLNRPGKRNALTRAMYDAIADALEGWRADPQVACIVIAGEGAHFSAGNDIDDFLDGYSFEPGAAWRRFLDATMAFEKPMLLAAQGRAVGLGLTWMLLCDVVLVAPDLRASGPFVPLGLTPEAASSLTLPALVGHRRAFEVFALGREITAAEAVDWNIATRMAGQETLFDETMALARQVADLPQEGLRQTMGLLRASRDVQDAYGRERQGFIRALYSDETQGMMTAMRDRMRK